MSETRKLAAILVADVVGYSRLAGADEERTLARLRALRSDLIDPTIALHHGRVVKRTGDGSIIEFRIVVDAVRCAIEVQTGLIERNAGVSPERADRTKRGPVRSGGIGRQAFTRAVPVVRSRRSARPRQAHWAWGERSRHAARPSVFRGPRHGPTRPRPCAS